MASRKSDTNPVGEFFEGVGNNIRASLTKQPTTPPKEKKKSVAAKPEPKPEPKAKAKAKAKPPPAHVTPPELVKSESEEDATAGNLGAWLNGVGQGLGLMTHRTGAFVGLGAVDREKTAVLKQLETRMFDGSIGKIATDDCVVELHGEAMPLASFAAVCAACKKAFPQWNMETEDTPAYTLLGKVKMGTQQKTGPMKGNMPATRGFPAVYHRDAPAEIKKPPGLILPVEIGVFTFDESGGPDHLKINSMVWDGALGETSDSNTMDMEPCVGMGVIYNAIGRPLDPNHRDPRA